MVAAIIESADEANRDGKHTDAGSIRHVVDTKKHVADAASVEIRYEPRRDRNK